MSFEKAVTALAEAGQDDATVRQSLVLLAIHRSHGEPPRTVRGIAGYLGVPPSAVTRACDRFTSSSPPLVTREWDQTDHRSVNLGLTDAGRELAKLMVR